MSRFSNFGKNNGGPFSKSFSSIEGDDRVIGDVISYKVSPIKAMEMVEKAYKQKNIVNDLNTQIARYKKTLK
ncbi:MAG: hypothetical protein IJH34_09810 [Romboutsia sp.]|nr:hypothetical protein [Romboutsia sp.]